MIFALTDYFRYRLRRGVYGDDPARNIMALGHEGNIEAESIALMHPGDVVICQRMNSALSWATMYFGGRYAVDHVAIYVGDRQVLHATLSGVRQHSIDVLARGARILPYRAFAFTTDKESNSTEKQDERESSGEDGPVKQEAHDEVIRPSNEYLWKFPPHIQLLLVGIEITLGLRPTSFRWPYYFDVGFIAAILDALLWPINEFPMTLTIWLCWLFVLFALQRRFRKLVRAGRKFERDSHPGLVILQLMANGGYIFPSKAKAGALVMKISPS